MNKVMSATEARVHFGELMQHVVENSAPVIVERAGKPQVVVMSVAEYERLSAASEMSREDVFEDILTFARKIQADRQEPFPPPEEAIRQMRKERDEQLLDNLP
ncbi:MAG: type II toxin-antitoxin system Phd/YefM family antitoxin [Chloroflexi bacterium]|nr:type II toxin-antitoxin system Phd/YefM family antitoxin [Chloroflexota bacterium]